MRWYDSFSEELLKSGRKERSKMRCLQCSKKIGLLRRLVDRQFCCDGHRKRARQVYSARMARDLHYEDSQEDGWLQKTEGTTVSKPSAAFGPGAGVLLVVVSTLMVMFLPSTSSSNGKGGGAAESYLPPVAGLTDRLSRAFPSSKTSISIREDFHVDLRNWQNGVSGLASGWAKVGDSVRVGELRLWKPTLALSDYNIQFAGQIESKALGWAFRARDSHNYYATKIAIHKGGGLGDRAEIIRYTMLNGSPINRVTLPIPIPMTANMTYEVKMGVRGDRFTTMVNGQAVDSWSDRRLRRGGVGFFSEPGERSILKWVSIAERESFLQRFLSFSFLVHPSAWPVDGDGYGGQPFNEE